MLDGLRTRGVFSTFVGGLFELTVGRVTNHQAVEWGSRRIERIMGSVAGCSHRATLDPRTCTERYVERVCGKGHSVRTDRFCSE